MDEAKEQAALKKAETSVHGAPSKKKALAVTAKLNTLNWQYFVEMEDGA